MQDDTITYADIILAQKLIATLIELNNKTTSTLWDSQPDIAKRVLRFEQESTVLKIIKFLGRDLFEGLIDLRDKTSSIAGASSICIREFKKINFEVFIVTANHEVEVQLGIYDDVVSVLPDYNIAWKLLCGMAELFNTSDQFFAKRVDSTTLGQGSDYEVVLANPFRAYLYRIVETVQLQDVVSDALYDNDANAGEQSFVKPYQICDWMHIDDLCNDLDIIEKFIRSMCKIKGIDKFVFGIDEVIDDSTKVKMTLAEYINYECKQQLK